MSFNSQAENFTPGRDHAAPTTITEPTEGILKTIMGLRGLDISEESTFDFEVPQGWKQWPGARYGPDSPHLQFAKAKKAAHAKRQPQTSLSPRPLKTKKPKSTPKVKKQPAAPTVHAPAPKRDPPLHLLTLPGEMRDLIYDIIAIHDGPIYPQIRPVQKPSKTQRGRKKLAFQRFPPEPVLAQVNHQLRKEVLSMFYGGNKFVFRPSTINFPALERFRMTSPLVQMKWRLTCLSPQQPRYGPQQLRHVELRLAASGERKQVVYTLKKLITGTIKITHSLTDIELCPCLEDDAVRETLAGVEREEFDLLQALYHLGMKRKAKLAAIAKVDHGNGGLHRMPIKNCLYCHKPHLTHVSDR